VQAANLRLHSYTLQGNTCYRSGSPEMEPGRPGHGSRVTGSPGQHFRPGRVRSRVSVQYCWPGSISAAAFKPQ